MAKSLQGPPKFILFALVAGGLFYGLSTLQKHGIWINSAKSTVPKQAQEVNAQILSHDAVKALPMPSSTPVPPHGPIIHYERWAWNGGMGFHFANGGPTTTVGSIMASHNVYMEIRRQDDTSQMQTDLLAFAKAIKNGDPNPRVGVAFVDIMGDGAAQFFAALQKLFAQNGLTGDDYSGKIIGAHGRSDGEDGLWGQAAWKDNPQSARGALIAGVLRDGDWNIAMKWAAMNGIPNNPDDKIYDPNALNWVSADTYTRAAELYVTGFQETLPVKGRPGQTKSVAVNGVVTWTPGDVTIAKRRGGLVPILTTRESVFQMPCVIVGINKWNATHRDLVRSLLAGSFQGADQIRSNPAALDRAAAISAAIYREETAGYWKRYYIGVTEPDAQGMRVPLGGSAVSNLADNLQLFGLTEGSGNIMKADYETFGDIASQQYPKLLPSYPKYESVVDTSFLTELRDGGSLPTNNTESISFDSAAPVKEVIGRKDYSIQFRTGSAEILPGSFKTLNQIRADVLMTLLAVEVHGHTDNVGSPEVNEALSKSRAASVKRYLQQGSATTLPDNRIREFAHGSSQPVDTNDTESGRAHNRRVQIVLGKV